MKETVRRFGRTAQTYFPGLQAIKADAQNRLAWITGRLFDSDYQDLRLLRTGGNYIWT